MEKSVKECVECLPEIYQRIYGHEEYDDRSSRACVDRVEVILSIIHDYAAKTGKQTVRVLDLGCAQGFYSLSLQKDGCVVDGIDYLDKNINCCNALAEESGLKCNFQIAELDQEFADNIPERKYDVILMMSVIHHIAYAHSFEYARRIVDTIASKAAVLVFELAVKQEDLFWNVALPDTFEHWFDHVGFYDVLSYTDTHLSEVKRPFLFVSNRYIYCAGQRKLYSFSEWSGRAYADKPENLNCRYYQVEENMLAKFFRDPGSQSAAELRTEWKEIRELQGKVTYLPEIVMAEETNDRLMSLYRIHKGTLLWQYLQDNIEFDRDKVLHGVLLNLVELEKNHRYHGDLRSWNVCIDRDGNGYVIDFGCVQKTMTDDIAEAMCINKNGHISVFDSFVALLFDVVERNTYESIAEFGNYQLNLSWNPNFLPEKFRNFVYAYILLNPKNISFSIMDALYQKYVIEKKELELSIEEKLLAEIQLVQKSQTVFAAGIDVFNQINRVNEKVDFLWKKNDEVNKNLDEQAETTEALWKKSDEVNKNLDEQAETTAALWKKSDEVNRNLNEQAETTEALWKKNDEINKNLNEQAGTLETLWKKSDEVNKNLDEQAETTAALWKKSDEVNRNLNEQAETTEALWKKNDEINKNLNEQAGTLETLWKKSDDVNIGLAEQAENIKNIWAKTNELEKVVVEQLNAYEQIQGRKFGVFQESVLCYIQEAENGNVMRHDELKDLLTKQVSALQKETSDNIGELRNQLIQFMQEENERVSHLENWWILKFHRKIKRVIKTICSRFISS